MKLKFIPDSSTLISEEDETAAVKVTLTIEIKISDSFIIVIVIFGEFHNNFIAATI